MNNDVQERPSMNALVALAVGAGLLWRVELEMRGGWAGLVWLEYFHWAVPVSIAAFIAWTAMFVPVRRRILFVLSLILFAVVGFVVTRTALQLIFMGGPSAFVQIISLGDGDVDRGFDRYRILRWLSFVVWPLIPLFFCLLCRLFGARITLKRATCSAVLFTAAWPLAMVIRVLFVRGSEADLIHTVKSGVIIPFLVIALGFPFIQLRYDIRGLIHRFNTKILRRRTS